MTTHPTTIQNFLATSALPRFHTVLADPPWKFGNSTGKSAPEHKRLKRYATMPLDEIMSLPVYRVVGDVAHLYLWVPNALLSEGLQVMAAWGFTYKTQLIWHKVAKDGTSDRRCMGFYFRNCTESLLFGIRGPTNMARTVPPWNLPNLFAASKREHSRKPDESFALIERASPGPYLELFAREPRAGWFCVGDQL